MDGKRVFCNPPYSNIEPWVRKALSSKAMTVLLLPCRSDTLWFSMLVRDAEVRFFRKRMDLNADGARVHPAESSIVAVVRKLQ